MLYTIALWWPPAGGQDICTAATVCRLCRLRSWGQPTSPARLHSARSAEERRALSAAARWLECVRGTDKALGESQLSRPLTRATATPSTRMCALHVCRHPCTSALARMLACHMRLCLGRLWDHSKDSCMSLFHPFANCQTHGTMTVALVFESQLSRCRAATVAAFDARARTPSREPVVN